MGNHLYVALPVLALLAVVQSAVLPHFPLAGVTPQLLFVVALAWGLLRGFEEGMIWAFIAGLFVDLFSLAPMGVSSLAFMAGVAGPLLLQRVMPPRRLLVSMTLVGLGTLIYLLAYFLLLRIAGHSISFGGMVELLPLVLFHAILIVPVYLILNSILRAIQPRRVQI